MPNPVGRPPKFETPEALWASFEMYVAHCKDNPIAVQERGAKEVMTVYRDQPITLLGFCVFAEIGRQTLDDYGAKKEFSDTITRIKTFTRTYCSERAMVGAFDSRFVGGYFATEGEESKDEKTEEKENKITVEFVTSKPNDDA